MTIDVDGLVRLAAGSSAGPLPARWRHGQRVFDFVVPGDSVWICVKDDLLLREYEWAGVRLDDVSGVVIDAGAHVGTFSAMASSHAQRVIAIEPNPAMVAMLRANLKRNGIGNVKVVERALWGANETRTLDAEPVTCSGNVLTDVSAGLRVETVTLDQLVADLGEVDLLKFDIEGAEFAVFDGASDNALRSVSRLVGEIHLFEADDADLQRLVKRLQHLGFVVDLRHGPVYHVRDSLSVLVKNWRSLHGYLRLKLAVAGVYLLTGALDPVLHLRHRFGGEVLRLLYAERRGDTELEDESRAADRFEAGWADIDPIEGWLTREQAKRVWDVARRLRAPAKIVEIGSHRGRSTTVLASAAAPGVEVIAIDPHDGAPGSSFRDQDLSAFLANLEKAGLKGVVRHLRKRSQDALEDVDGKVDLVFVDGDHGFGPALGDIQQWGGRVSPGGTLFLHDSFNAVGLTLAQLRSLVFDDRFRFVGRRGSLSEYRREDLCGRERAANTVRQLAQLGYTARSNAIKLLLRLRLRPAARLLGHRSAIGPF